MFVLLELKLTVNDIHFLLSLVSRVENTAQNNLTPRSWGDVYVSGIYSCIVTWYKFLPKVTDEVRDLSV